MMSYRRLLRPQALLFVALALVLMIAVACGEEEEPTSVAPAADPTATSVSQAADVPTPTSAPEPTPTQMVPVASAPQGTLNVAKQDVLIFDSHPGRGGAVGYWSGFYIGERLVKVNTENQFEPRLAREWELSDDTLTWTLRLEEGVEFHKGYGEFTADDVIWTVEQIVAEESLHAFKSQVTRLWRIDEGGTTKIDDYTVQVNTGTPQFDMLNVMKWHHIPMMSKAQFDAEGRDGFNNKGVGTGPWEMIDHEGGQKHVMTAVTDHWRKTPEFGDYIIWHMPEESTRVASFQTDQIDTYSMILDSMPAIESVEGSNFLRVPGGTGLNLGFYGNWYVGHGTPEFAENVPGYDPSLPWVSGNPDPNSEEWKTAAQVRLALSMAINRQAIVDTVLRGEGRAITLPWFDDDELPDDIPAVEFNPDKAKQLLADAGYPNGFSLDLTPYSGEPLIVQVTEVIASMWEDIGIRANLNLLSYPTLRPSLVNHDYNGIYTHPGVGNFLTSLDIWGVVFNSDTGWNFGMHHPMMDAMLAKATGIMDPDERWEVVLEMARFLHDNTLQVGVYDVNVVWPLSKKIDSSRLGYWYDNLNFSERSNLTGTAYIPRRQ